VVAKGGQHENKAPLVQVPHSVQLMKSPVCVMARFIPSVPEGRVVVGCRHAGYNQPVSCRPMTEKPKPERLDWAAVVEEEKVLQYWEQVFQEETLFPTQDEEDTKK